MNKKSGRDLNPLVLVCYCFEISSLLNKQGIVLLT